MTWAVTHSAIPRVSPSSTIRQSGTLSVGSPTIASTPAHRLKTAFSRLNGVKSRTGPPG